jgi:hypothetical protein
VLAGRFELTGADSIRAAAAPQVDQVLVAAIAASCEAAGLQPEPSFITKVVQLQETCNVRFGVMLVGAAGEPAEPGTI